MGATDGQEIPGDDRREWRRYQLSGGGTLSLPVPGRVAATLAVTCVNQGAGGLSVRCPSPAAVGQEGVVRFPPGFRRRIEVVRCTMLEPTVMAPDRRRASGDAGTGPRARGPDRRRVGGGPRVVSSAVYELGLRFIT